MLPPPPSSTLFPYTTLFRSLDSLSKRTQPVVTEGKPQLERAKAAREFKGMVEERKPLDGVGAHRLCVIADRKSTRLNSSHVRISYAVFCLKKKKKEKKK